MSNVTIHDLTSRAALRTDELEVQAASAGASARVVVSAILATMVSADVTAALGYTPANAASLAAVATSGSASDLTSGTIAAGRMSGANIITALGYTPVNPSSLAAIATSGSASDLASGTVAAARLSGANIGTALGYTPANKAGETFTGALTVASSSDNALRVTQGVAGAQLLAKFDVADASAADWNLEASRTANDFSARSNVVYGFGYNVTPYAAREASAEPALYFAFETFYTPSNGVEMMEAHLTYVNTSNLVVRPWSFLIDRNAESITGIIRGNPITFQTPTTANTAFIQFAPDKVSLLGTSIHAINNQAILTAANAAGNNVYEILRLDNTDKLQILPGGQTVAFGGPITVGGISGGITCSGSIVPTVLNNVDLGATGKNWKTVYFINLNIRDGGGTNREAVASTVSDRLLVGGGFGTVQVPNSKLIVGPTSTGNTADLAIVNSTTATTVHFYRSFTDTSNYTRGVLQTAANTIELAAQAAGTGDSNIDVLLTPKGTGNVKFGTHSAIAAEALSGYITIKDAGGTSRKLAVVS